MLFPVVVHKDGKSSFGVTIPDFLGCFTAGETFDEAIKSVQEAIECHLDEGDKIPEPSSIELLANNPEVDLSAFENRTKRINVSIPESLLHEIDSFARKNSLS